ncbi:MAG: sn-glycerol-3-phosphate ABC transporter ATP-binding protein UgpC [Clostridia bacterium]
MASIVLKNVKKVYPGNVTAVHEFNLDIEDKEFIILVGPSGCGKSTTLRMIAGLEEISEGELYIGENLVNDVPPKDRDIAMVFQSYALYPHMTVYKNMAFALKLRKESKEVIDEKVQTAAASLDITHLLTRKPKALSGGQRQRVALGRAMVRNPAVFLLDEPLSNLDAKLRAQMRSELTTLHKKLQTTFVYVTHDQVEAMTMGDRIVVMKDGYIQQVDSPQELYDNPCNLFVAGFIGTPQMNFIEAVVNEKNGSYFADFAEYSIKLPEGRFSPEALATVAGKPVTLGIRPEDLHREEIFLSAENAVVLNLTVNAAEMMGAEVYMYCACGENSVTVKTPTRSAAKSGDIIKLAVDTNKLHVYNKETGNAVK